MILALSPAAVLSRRNCAGGMAECHDFFDDPAAAHLNRSSALHNDTSPSDLPQVKDVGLHCLELTLGPSNFSSSSISPPTLQHDTVRASPAYSFLQRQSSGNFASATSHTSQTPLLQADVPKVSSGQHEVAAGLGRQRSGNFACNGEPSGLPLGSRADSVLPVKALLPDGNSTFPSRDQIWQTLQKSGTLFERAQLSTDASSMWSRRAASMQAVFPRNVGDDLEHCRIRRSCSNGILARAEAHHFSNIESPLERSSQQSMVSAQHPQHEELEDLQKRKEMQAQRRLEARKRRRNFFGEKQHKKGRQNSGILHTGSRQSIYAISKFSLAEMPSGEEDAVPGSQCISHDEPKLCRSDDLKKGMQELPQDSRSDMQASSVEDIERLSQDMQVDGGKLNASIHAYGECSGLAKEKTLNFLSNEHDLGSHGSMTSCELEHSGPITKLLVPSTEHECCKPPATMNHHVRMPVSEVESATPFPGSEVNCTEINGAPTDAANEGDAMRGVTFSSGSVGCPPLIFSPMQYAYATAGATPPATVTQPIFPFPYNVQNAAAGSCENGSTTQSSSAVHSACPPVNNMCMGTFPRSTGGFLSRTTSVMKDFVGDSEGKRGSGEKSAFAPIPRTISNLKTVFGDPRYSGAHLDLQVSLAGSQLSSTTTVVSDASNSKNLLLERRPSWPLGARLLSQKSCVVDQSFLCSRQENLIPCQSRVSGPFETPTLRLNNSNLKQEEGAKQEEGSSESQLASEHSGVDASYAQSTVIEKQRSGTYLDFPWVTTTGKGPQGKTINGVLYIANGRQVRLVCSCHSKHMSPAEFVEHSGSSDLSNPERNIVVSPSPHVNHQVASTPV